MRAARLARPGRVSLRRRLVWQIAGLFALLMLALFFTVRFAAERASRSSHDAVLGAAVISIADGIRAQEDGLELDLPYASFSMLGAMGNERIFYSLSIKGRVLAGHEGLSQPNGSPGEFSPQFWDASYRGNRLRLAAVTRRVLLETHVEQITVVLGQTRYGQAAIAGETARFALWVGLGFTVLVIPFTLLAVRSVIRPINNLARLVSHRGPADLRPVRHPVPRELSPLIRSLNGFIARLREALALAETFIFEAAHRIRTPLSLVRTEAELALGETTEETTRQRLRKMLRAINESSRSASQILDHAMVLYRSDQFNAADVDFTGLAASVLRSVAPLADMREITLTARGLDQPCHVWGDERMIEVALRNILDNALKYSYDEGRVTIRLTCAGGRICLTVKDEGRGLVPGDSNLQDRFRRGSNVGNIIGSGLGLTIVDQVATAHQGRFILQSRPEGGTCAKLSLPLSASSLPR